MTQDRRILMAAAALAGGLLAAAVLSPERTRATAKYLSRRMASGPGGVDFRLDQVEERLSALEQQIHDTSEELRRRLAEAGQRTLDRYVPGDALSGDDWHLTKGDVDEDLPRLRGKE